MLEAIRNAKRSVALASYIFRYDVTGRAFIDALVAAHKRGVAVRVLLDSVGSGYFWSGTLRDLKRGGVPAARFLHTWLPWRMPFLNMRNHKKLLIVDGEIGFTGGLNIGAGHSRRLVRKHNEYVDDVQVRVEGPVVRQLLQTFAQDWSFTTDEDLTRRRVVAQHRARRSGLCARHPLRTRRRHLQAGDDPGRGAGAGAPPRAHRHALFPAQPAHAVRHRAGGLARRRG